MGTKATKLMGGGGGRKNSMNNKNNNNNNNNDNNNTMDIYNTVWLSDYESVKSFGSQSGISSLNQSKIIETFVNNANNNNNTNNNNNGVDEDEQVHHSSPKQLTNGHFLQQTGWCRTCARRYSPQGPLRRTLSLPELDMSTLRPADLQDRFSQLQLEQENSELRLLVDQLQNALETIEKSMNLNNLPGQARKSPKKDSGGGGRGGERGSMDSLDEMYADAMNENRDSSVRGDKKKTSSKRDESGYNSTFNQDSQNSTTNDDHDDDGSREFRKYNKKDRYSDYSDGSGSEADDFYESRLSKKQRSRFEGDESNCCVIH